MQGRKTFGLRRFFMMTGKLAIILIAVAMGACKSGSSDTNTDSQSVGAGNNAPAISGSPVTITRAGDAYSFIPTASDPDGDALVFSIQNKPAWSGFSTATGKLSGTPQLEDLGTYSDIVVTASDGESSDSLAGFSIDVVETGMGSVILSWAPPTQNTDGSALTDLAGYRIYYGVEEHDFPNMIIIDNPGIASYLVEGLTPNTYYFAATAVNANGIESDFSNITTKIVG